MTPEPAPAKRAWRNAPSNTASTPRDVRSPGEGEESREPDRCPTCGRTGPDDFYRVGDYGGGPWEARCGDDWHDDKAPSDA